MERTLVIIKPDAMNRDLAGKIIARFEAKGLKIAGIKMETLGKEMLGEHYAHHREKPFFPGLVKFMSGAPCIFLALEGKDAADVVRKMCGATNGRNAEAGTIRGDFSVSTQANLVHASDSKETAEKEIKRFFKAGELHEYEKCSARWMYSEDENK
ncbi:MAG: nucleoside-diphosphate kinase [Candidatus Diapherotrites archaeon]